MRKVGLLLALLALPLAAAQDYVFGITFDAGGKFDGSFNEGTWNGLTQAVSELEEDEGLVIDVLEFEGTPDTAAEGLRNIAAQGAELILSPGFLQADAVAAASSEFPDTFFVLIDAEVDNPNVRSVLFKEHEGSYLVGYLAGMMTQTGTVGFVGGMDIPLIRAFDLGYQEGVRAACPECRIVSNYVGSTPAAWNDPARARELATTQQAQGADIIYAAAGASGNGVIDFVTQTMCYQPQGELRASPLAEVLAEIEVSSAYAQRCGEGSQPLFFIGVDSNQNFRGDTDDNPETLNHGLTSMLKRVDVAAYNAVYDVVEDTFEGGTQVLGLAEDGVGYALDEFNEALIPQSVIDELESVRQRIIEGEVVVPDFREQ
ncbi:BMP family lipoprotein [Truepera radiovictrix]|uniref:Basic membrane lipoprotein n=1 Tax=Truepera radiovictrix (strain DSM 17093 / CIP 108686 / LMG 22925 / RQ-24) TaxID=649638 RepID=D7CY77_TRURR|nr:BMP family ABC transporter substrate-binding protein [Truepera radiovictrix]ADI14716.1 basic membrane lipoprotein [Truepera radiovictrix DSM 17093]WMT56734.1 BMP family ABC transporter substrate-binding protein [Truepera radiovictrix]